MHNIHFQSLTGEIFNSTVWWRIKLSRLLGNNLCLSWFITTSPGHSSQSSPISSPLFNSTVVISFSLSTTATSATDLGLFRCCKLVGNIDNSCLGSWNVLSCHLYTIPSKKIPHPFWGGTCIRYFGCCWPPIRMKSISTWSVHCPAVVSPPYQKEPLKPNWDPLVGWGKILQFWPKDDDQ